MFIYLSVSLGVGVLTSLTGVNVRAVLQNVTRPSGRGISFAIFNLTDDMGKVSAGFETILFDWQFRLVKFWYIFQPQHQHHSTHPPVGPGAIPCVESHRHDREPYRRVQHCNTVLGALRIREPAAGVHDHQRRGEGWWSGRLRVALPDCQHATSPHIGPGLDSMPHPFPTSLPERCCTETTTTRLVTASAMGVANEVATPRQPVARGTWKSEPSNWRSGAGPGGAAKGLATGRTAPSWSMRSGIVRSLCDI